MTTFSRKEITMTFSGAGLTKEYKPLATLIERITRYTGGVTITDVEGTWVEAAMSEFGIRYKRTVVEKEPGVAVRFTVMPKDLDLMLHVVQTMTRHVMPEDAPCDWIDVNVRDVQAAHFSCKSRAQIDQ